MQSALCKLSIDTEFILIMLYLFSTKKYKIAFTKQKKNKLTL